MPPSNKRPPPLQKPNVESFFTFLAISQPKMVLFSFRKNLLKGGNVPFKAAKLAKAHGRLLCFKVDYSP